MPVCLFANCRNDRKDTSITFFRVPKDPKLRKAWFLRSKRADLTLAELNDNYVVCERHFDPSQLYEEQHGNRIRKRVRNGEEPRPATVTASTSSRSRVTVKVLIKHWNEKRNMRYIYFMLRSL